MGPRRFNFGTPWGPLGPGSFQGPRAGQSGRPPMKILKNDLKMKDSGPGTFIFEKSAKNYVQGFNESF